MSIQIVEQGSIERDIRSILKQAGDPRKFRAGLARIHGVSEAEVDSVIEAAGGAPRVADPETLAQERLREEAAEARRDPQGFRHYNHEEV